MRVAVTVAGIALTLIVWLSVLRTVFTPKPRPSRAASWTTRAVGSITLLIARRLPGPVREHFLGYSGPLMLFTMAAVWLAADIAAFVLTAWGLGQVPFSQHALGGFFALRAQDTVLPAVAWLSVAFLMTSFAVHLIRVASAYGRRESLLSRLSAQATRSPDAEMMLARYARSRMQLGALFDEWSDWLAEVQTTHLAYPALLYYRSAGGAVCWTGAAQIMLDCAALTEACAPRWAPPQTGSLLTVGERCLPQLAAHLGIDLPSAPVSYQGREAYPFSRTLTEIRQTKLPIEVDEESAQAAFQRRRVRYAPFANAICERLLYEYTDQ